MYANADQLPNGSTLGGFDICIAGAGAAGIAMATRLIGTGKKVLVLCSGLQTDSGINRDQARETIYHGTLGPFLERVDPIFLQRSRLNMYGGTTNHFWFYAHPMDEVDLKPRPGYRDAAWPIGLEELNRYYPDANAFGPYGPFNYGDIEFWAEALHGAPFLPQPDDSLENVIWHGQEDASLYQFQTQFDLSLQLAPSVTILFNANVLQVEANPQKDHITGLACSSIDHGKPGVSFRVEAGAYVLAMGGIEPVRLLKISGNLGDNAKGHLGRGFMLHPLIFEAAHVTFPVPVDLAVRNFYRLQPVVIQPPPAQGGSHRLVTRAAQHPSERAGSIKLYAWAMLAPTAAALARERIGAFHTNVMFQPGGDTIHLSINWESVPNEGSAITLNPGQNDPVFGQPVAHVDWNLLERDKCTIVRGLELLRAFFVERGATAFEITTDLSGGPGHWTFDSGSDRRLQPGDHHMGALRMSAAPEDGIVNPDSRVHSIDNLYVAGSGVYRTTGHANPTLTIVALALRLADHLIGK